MRSAHARFRDTGLSFHPRSTSRSSTCSTSKSPLRLVVNSWHEPRKKEKKRKEKIRGRREEYRWHVIRLGLTSLFKKCFSVSLAVNLAITREFVFQYMVWRMKGFFVWIFIGWYNILDKRDILIDQILFLFFLTSSWKKFERITRDFEDQDCWIIIIIIIFK